MEFVDATIESAPTEAKCPFHKPEASTEAASKPGKCPFDHRAATATESSAQSSAEATVSCASDCDKLCEGLAKTSIVPAPDAHAAPVKWAQRNASLYITIPLSNVNDAQFQFSDNGLLFTGSSNGQAYYLNLTFFKEIEPETSLWKALPLSIQIKIVKKVKTGGFWPRLLLDKQQEKTNVTVDWSRYVDEDDNAMDFCTRHLQDDIQGFAGEKIAEKPKGGGGGKCPFGGDRGMSFGSDEEFSDFGADDDFDDDEEEA